MVIACGSNILTNVLPHLIAKLQTQATTNRHVTPFDVERHIGRHNCQINVLVRVAEELFPRLSTIEATFYYSWCYIVVICN